MGAYLIRRVIIAVLMLFVISVCMFGILHLIPGGPLAVYLSAPGITAKELAQLRHELGLDQPLVVQYWRWLRAFLVGDWGYSLVASRPAVQVVMERLPATIELMGAAFVLAGILSLPIGIYSAIRQYGIGDYAVTLFSFFGISMPVFWSGLMLQLLFAVRLGWLPSSGIADVNNGSLVDHLRHLVLPASVLALLYVARWTRYIRSSMLEVIGQDYVRTARAKGLSEWQVVGRHALRNALIPVVTVVAVDLGALFSGAVVTETVFAWPGIGQLFVSSVLKVDYTVLMGILMLGSCAVIVFNLLADLLYGIINPRVRLG